MAERKHQDSMIMAVPRDMGPSDPRLAMTIYAACVSTVYQQFEDRTPEILFDRIDTLVTGDLKEVDDWPILHDCDKCRQGVNTAREHIEKDPENNIVAMANITYREVLP